MPERSDAHGLQALVPNRALLVAVALLGCGLLWAELLAFRLCAASVGKHFAALLALLAPAVAAVGATVLRPRRTTVAPAALARRASRWTLGSATAWVAGLLALAWLSQRAAVRPSEVPGYARPLVLTLWLLAFGFGGAALSVALRRGLARVGRVAFAGAVGGALGGLVAPWIMAVGAPRGALAAGLVLGLGCVAFASAVGPAAGRAERPRWAVAVACPLAVMTLLLGDIGAPWLELRTDTGRRSAVAEQLWTAQGLVSLRRVSRGRRYYTVDRSERIGVAKKPLPGQKPRPKRRPVDLGYALASAGRGPVLVVASGGGREVAVARLYGAEQVHALELNPAVVSEVMLDRCELETRGLFRPSAELGLELDDGRAGLGALSSDYQLVVVVGSEPYVQALPRLIGWSDRLYSQEAIRAYLDRLAADGAVVLRTSEPELGGLMRAAEAALGGEPAEARQHLMACSERQSAALLVKAAPLLPAERDRLRKHCKRQRFSAHESPSAAEPGAAPDGEAPSDDRPFLERAPTVGSLLGLGWSAVTSELWRRSAKPKAGASEQPEADKALDPVPQPAPTAASERAGLFGLSTLAAAALALLLMVIPPPRAHRDAARPPRCLKVSLLLAGAALSLGLLSLTDHLLRLLGHAEYAWTTLIPAALLAVGAGRLWVDALPSVRLGRAAVAAGLLGSAALALLMVLAPSIGSWVAAPLSVRALVALALLALVGVPLGVPLAAGLRWLGHLNPAAASGGWAAHAAGWALGVASGALLARYLGVSRLFLVAAALSAAGALCAYLAGRLAPSEQRAQVE